MDTWKNFKKSRSKKGNLEPLVITDDADVEHTFVFPASPSAEFGLEMMELVAKHEGQIPSEAAAGLIPALIGSENAKRLKTLLTMEELEGLVADLFEQYGFTAEEGGSEEPGEEEAHQK